MCKFIVDLVVLMVFSCLFVRFRKDFKNTNMFFGPSTMILVRITVVSLCVLFAVNSLMYSLAKPISYYYYEKHGETIMHDAQEIWHHRLLRCQWIQNSADFLSCLTTMYLMHAFGPYHQFKR